MKIGIIKEGKVPIDRRVALTPAQAKEVEAAFPGTQVIVQKSDIRCFSDEEYAAEGIAVTDNVHDCDILMGIKEVPPDILIAQKTYLFFSHTTKKQAYNRELLRAVMSKHIRLIDYEMLTDSAGNRIIAFGRWAGIVGAYNGLWAYGRRYNLFHLRRAYECRDYEDLKGELEKIKLPAVKILITGGGRVAKGAMELLMVAGIEHMVPHKFLKMKYVRPVFCQINSRDYHFRIDGGPFKRHEFFNHPEKYASKFWKYAKTSDILIAGAFWDPRAPVLFSALDVMSGDFRIKVIADITCDIQGSIPSTKKFGTIEDPVYDYNPSEDTVEKALTDEANLTVMAVDNLPCELPKDASEDFGRQLINHVLPALLSGDKAQIILRATITDKGKLLEPYGYLKDYVGE